MNLLIAVLILVILYLLTERRQMVSQLKFYKNKIQMYLTGMSGKVDGVNRAVTEIKNKLEEHGSEESKKT